MWYVRARSPAHRAACCRVPHSPSLLGGACTVSNSPPACPCRAEPKNSTPAPENAPKPTTGQLGHGDEADRAVPTPIKPLRDTDFKQVKACRPCRVCAALQPTRARGVCQIASWPPPRQNDPWVPGLGVGIVSPSAPTIAACRALRDIRLRRLGTVSACWPRTAACGRAA